MSQASCLSKPRVPQIPRLIHDRGGREPTT
jgi:hypothetical protein